MYIIVIFVCYLVYHLNSSFAKKISMTLLSQITIVICSIQNSDGPKLISELLFLSQEAAGPQDKLPPERAGTKKLGPPTSDSQDPREKLQHLAPMEKKRNHKNGRISPMAMT